VSAASQFLKSGDVLLEENARGERKSYPVAAGGLATEFPLAVLINRGSASASEIVAGALQDHQRGSLIGERTFGTGTVLSPFSLDDGSELYLGVAQWLTPNGRAIRKVGIQPDIAVALPAEGRPLSPAEERTMSAADVAKQRDLQLAKAIDVLSASSAMFAGRLGHDLRDW